MNKKGYVVTYLPFKKYLIWSLVIVGLVIVYYFYVFSSAGLISLPRSCPQRIIPERVLLEYNMINSGGTVFPVYTKDDNSLVGICESKNAFGDCINPLAKWGDGSPLVNAYGMMRISCYRGYLQGENVNYFYCKDLYYSNTLIDNKGVVGKKINLKINLVIDPKDYTNEGYKIIDSVCKS